MKKRVVSLLLVFCLFLCLASYSFAAEMEYKPSVRSMVNLPYIGDKDTWDMSAEQAQAYAQVIEKAFVRIEEFSHEEPSEVYVSFFDVNGNTAMWLCGISILDMSPENGMGMSLLPFGDKSFRIAFVEIWEWDGSRAIPFPVVDQFGNGGYYTHLFVNLWPGGMEVFTYYPRTDVSGNDWDAMYPFADGKISTEPEWCRGWACVDDYLLGDYGISSAGKSTSSLAKEYIQAMTSSHNWPEFPFDWSTLDVQDYIDIFKATVSGGTGFQSLYVDEYGYELWPYPSGTDGTLLACADIASNDGRWDKAAEVMDQLKSISPSSDTLPTAARYVPYSEVIPASRTGSRFAHTSGALPQGLRLSAEGLLSGIPTELGSFSFKVTETYDGGSVIHECKLSVFTQYSMDVETFNEPGYGFVETAADDGRVQDQTVSAKEELKDQVMHLEGAYSQFQALYLDARLLTRDVDYTAEEGSTKLTVLAETIGDAGGGTHTLAAEFVTPDSTAPTGSRSVYTVQNYTVAGIASKEVHVTVKGELVLWTDAEPYIDTNKRTMTPFRAVGEALGLSVAWDSSTREASFTDGAKTIYFPIGSTTARTSDGSTVTMDTSAVIVNGRTYAPIRYLAEFFGWGVSWDGKTRTAAIG